MAGSDDIFNFLNDVWDLLPERDRDRFGETWKAYEQTYGDAWTKFIERDLAVNVDRVPLYNNQRWLLHTFNDDTKVERAAKFRSNQDLGKGLNLSARHLVNISVDGGTPIEIDLRGSDPTATTNVEIRDKINFAFGFKFCELVVLNALLDFTSPTKGVNSLITFHPASDSLKDATELVIGIALGDLPKSFPDFPIEFLLGDKLIVGIPEFRDTIHPEQATVILQEDIDYRIEFNTGIISFAATPPEELWAKNNLVNLQTPFNNFGFLMDFFDDNKPGYLKAVRGLWFAFWTGPRPENIRRSLYLLFGLPTANQTGTVTSITATQITITNDDQTVDVFEIPSGLIAVVSVGDTVSRFQPLVDGIVVLDKVNSPGFLEREVGRPAVEPFLTESASRGSGPNTDETRALKLLEEHTYLPQINVNSFISPDIKLANVRTFLRNIQPKSRTFLFQILVGIFRDQLLLKEELGLDIDMDVTPNVDSNPNTFAQQSDLDDAETNDATGIALDGEGWAMTEKIDVEVYHTATLVDSFTVEG